MAVAKEMVDNDWLGQFGKCRTKLISLGQELMHQRANKEWKPSTVVQPLRDIADIVTANDEDKQLLDRYLNRAWQDVSFFTALERYIEALEAMQLAKVWRDVLPLMAVKALLRCYDSYVLSCSANAVGETDVSGSLSPKVQGLGGGISYSGKASHSVDGHADLHPCLIPLVRVVDMCIEWAVPTETLSIGEALLLHARGYLSRSRAQEIVRLKGGVWDELKMKQLLERELPTHIDVIEYARRTGQVDQWTDDKLREIGITDDEDREIAKALYDEIPPVTDLLRFAQRNVTFPDIVARFGLEDEFKRFWFGQLKDGLTAQGISEEWAKLYWRSHWITASVGQAQESLQRLRPGRVDKAIEFNKDDFDNVMRENDILPFWRDRLRFLSYTPPGIRFIRELFNTRTIDDTKAIDMLEDIGYTHDDAKRLWESMTKMRARTLAAQGHGYTVAEIAKLYGEQGMTLAEAKKAMKALYYTDAETDKLIERVRKDRSIAKRVKFVAALQHGFVSGAFPEGQCRQELTNQGYIPIEVDDFISEWTVERNSHLHRGSPNELIQWFKHGLISVTELAGRLLSVGFDANAVNRTIQTVTADMAAVQKREIAAQVKAANALKAKAAAILAAQQKLAALRFAHNTKVKGKIAVAKDHEAFQLQEADLVGSIERLIAEQKDKVQKEKDKATLKQSTTKDKALQESREKTTLDLLDLQ